MEISFTLSGYLVKLSIAKPKPRRIKKGRESAFTLSQINEISTQLRHGDKKKLAHNLGKSLSHVNKVFKRDYVDDSVFNEALRIIGTKTAIQALKQNKIDEAIATINSTDVLLSKKSA